MLFSNYKIVISDDPTGKELKEFGDYLDLRYDYYTSYFLKNKPVRYFEVTQGRMRDLKFHVQNLRNKTDYKVYLVSPSFVKQYIKHGKIRKTNIQLNIGKILTSKLALQLYREIFFISISYKYLKVHREDHQVTFTYQFQNSFYKLELRKNSYKGWIDKDDVVIEDKTIKLIDRYLENKVSFKKKI
jgi:hypothetical protein